MAAPIGLEGEAVPLRCETDHSLVIDAVASTATFQEAHMIGRSKSILILALFVTLGVTGARAEDSNDRLLIVNGNSGHVIYDDGRDDLFCVTRRRVVGYDDYGHRIWRRRMRCR